MPAPEGAVAVCPKSRFALSKTNTSNIYFKITPYKIRKTINFIKMGKIDRRLIDEIAKPIMGNNTKPLPEYKFSYTF